jgi:hypothetical protein
MLVSLVPSWVGAFKLKGLEFSIKFFFYAIGPPFLSVLAWAAFTSLSMILRLDLDFWLLREEEPINC